jgi:acetoin utilization deacetylase AcuC-like enzyme
MPVVWSERCALHDPRREHWIGTATPATEVAQRTAAILDTLRAAGVSPVEAAEHGIEPLLAVHDRALVDYLEYAWARWEEAGLDEDPGQDRVVPYVFAHVALTSSPAVPAAASARAGYFAYDTMSLVGPGTSEAARAAVDVALTAVDLVADGAPHAYACGRPPGHHACRACFGGSCYLNSTAVAAASLLDRLGAPIAVLDVDAHHGNGTQEIFYGDPNVRVGSVHVDPGAGWFPHFLGFAGERGAGEGERANLNLPLAPGSGDSEWLEAVGRLAEWGAGARAVVVALGVDAAAGDPESPLQVSADGFRAAGRMLGRLRVPTVFVQEGGYDLAAIGPLVLETLVGAEEGAA